MRKIKRKKNPLGEKERKCDAFTFTTFDIDKIPDLSKRELLRKMQLQNHSIDFAVPINWAREMERLTGIELQMILSTSFSVYCTGRGMGRILSGSNKVMDAIERIGRNIC